MLKNVLRHWHDCHFNSTAMRSSIRALLSVHVSSVAALTLIFTETIWADRESKIDEKGPQDHVYPTRIGFMMGARSEEVSMVVFDNHRQGRPAVQYTIFGRLYNARDAVKHGGAKAEYSWTVYGGYMIRDTSKRITEKQFARSEAWVTHTKVY